MLKTVCSFSFTASIVPFYKPKETAALFAKLRGGHRITMQALFFFPAGDSGFSVGAA